MKKTLDDLRKEVDKLDTQLIKVVSKRTNIIKVIGDLKKTEGLELLNENRRKAVLKKWITTAKKEGLSGEIAEKIYKILHDYSIEIEKKDNK